LLFDGAAALDNRERQDRRAVQGEVNDVLPKKFPKHLFSFLGFYAELGAFPH